MILFNNWSLFLMLESTKLCTWHWLVVRMFPELFSFNRIDRFIRPYNCDGNRHRCKLTVKGKNWFHYKICHPGLRPCDVVNVWSSRAHTQWLFKMSGNWNLKFFFRKMKNEFSPLHHENVWTKSWKFLKDFHDKSRTENFIAGTISLSLSLNPPPSPSMGFSHIRVKVSKSGSKSPKLHCSTYFVRIHDSSENRFVKADQLVNLLNSNKLCWKVYAEWGPWIDTQQ